MPAELVLPTEYDQAAHQAVFQERNFTLGLTADRRIELDTLMACYADLKRLMANKPKPLWWSEADEKVKRMMGGK